MTVPRDVLPEDGNILIVELQSLSEKLKSHLPRSRFRQSGSSNQTTLTMMNRQSNHQCPLSPNQCLCSASLQGPLQVLRNRNPIGEIYLAVDVGGTWI